MRALTVIKKGGTKGGCQQFQLFLDLYLTVSIELPPRTSLKIFLLRLRTWLDIPTLLQDRGLPSFSLLLDDRYCDCNNKFAPSLSENDKQKSSLISRSADTYKAIYQTTILQIIIKNP